MSTNEAQWINPDKQLPTAEEAKAGIWIFNRHPDSKEGGYVELIRYSLGGFNPFSSMSRRRWKPAKGDIPQPPKEETQQEKDIEVFLRNFPNAAYVMPPALGNPFYVSDVWHRALSYERAWFRAELEKCLLNQTYINSVSASPTWINAEQLSAMRERCKETP